MTKKLLMLLLSAVLLLTALSAAAADEIYPAAVDLNLNAMALLYGGEGRLLTASVLPADAADAPIRWTSSNESVAVVDASGLVVPRSMGTAVITAQTDNGESDCCTVTVTDNPVLSVTLSTNELTMQERSAYVLEAFAEPMTAENTNITWQSSDKSIAVVNRNGKIFSKSPGVCTISAIADGGVDVIAQCDVTVTPSDKPMKYVALTFDDGPCKNTLALLEILEEYDVHATFFCVGEMVDRYPSYVRKTYARGHEIGNHSYDHQTLTTISLSQAKKQMTDTDKAVKRAIGIEPALYRAPGGSITETIARYCGKPFIGWTVDTLDWKYRDPEHVFTSIARNAENYDIILMHDLRPTTTEAMHKAIPYLLEQGFTLVTVSELREIKKNLPPT